MSAVVQPLARASAELWRPPAIVECPYWFQGRVPLTKQAIASPQGGFMVPNTPDIFWQVANPGLGNCFVAGNKDYLFMMNQNASLPRTVIIRSYPEPVFGRAGDLIITVDPFSENNCAVVAYPIPKLGYMQLDGNIWVDAQSTDILLMPLTFN